MSMFNSEQRDYMEALTAIPPEERCWCGWYMLGECRNCNVARPGQTCAEKMETPEWKRMRERAAGNK